MADAWRGRISIKVANGATLTIGEAPLIGYGAIVESWHGLKIGEAARHHPRPPPPVPGRTVIGGHASLRRNVVVTPDLTLGEGSVIGDNSVVTKDMPPISSRSASPPLPSRS